MVELQPLSDLADIRRGASPRPIGDPKYFGGDVGWVRISDVTKSARILRETEQYVSPLGESLSVRVNPGDLVMSICGTLGRPIIIGIPACIHDGFVQLFNLRKIEKTFLYYVLQNAESAFYAMGQPGTQTNLNTGLVGRHRIYLPTLIEQGRIAELLSTIDEIIEQTEALISKYQQIKAGLMHDLFTRGVTQDGHLRPSRKESPELYKGSPLGWIPKEWEVQRLGEILRNCGGYLQTGPFGSQLHAHEYQLEGVPVVMPQDINNGLIGTSHIARITERKAEEMAKHRMRVGDVVIARRGDLSRAAAISAFEQGWVCGTGCFLLRLGQSALNFKFATTIYGQHFIQRQIAGRSVGTTMPSMNNSVMEALFFPLCPEREQLQIVDRLDAMERNILALTEALAFGNQLKQGLMQDLLTGRVQVKSSGESKQGS